MSFESRFILHARVRIFVKASLLAHKKFILIKITQALEERRISSWLISVVGVWWIFDISEILNLEITLNFLYILNMNFY